MDEPAHEPRIPEPPAPSDPYAGLDHPDSAWNRAAAAEPQGDAFCCRTEWAFSFHESFDPERPLYLRERLGSVVGFAGRTHPQLGPLLEPVEAHWLFGNPLLGPGAVPLLDALLRELAGSGPPSCVLISGLRHGSLRCVELLTTFRDRYDAYRLPPNELCSASLAGGLDGYLSRRTAKHRRELARQARNAEARGVSFERHAPRSAAEAAAVYARMLDVEQRSWKGLGRCGMAEPPSREFYGLILRRLSRSGAGRVMFARADDADIGFICGGLAGRTYRGQQFSFVESWRRASLGNLLQLEQLRWLCEEGVRRYDMGPLMDYKRRWTEHVTQLETWLLRPAR